MKNINYTQVSNEFIGSMHRYDGSEVKVFVAISRKTIGWHKTTDRISYSQLAEITGLSINALKKAIKTLLSDNWIIQNKTKLGYEYDLKIEDEVSINDTTKTELYQPLIQPVSINDTVGVSTIDTTKEIIKETNKTHEDDKSSSSSSKFANDSKEIKASLYLFQKIFNNNPKTKKPEFQAWAQEFDYIFRIDKRTREDVKLLIDWTQSDVFWKQNILSPKKLRQHFDRLWLQMTEKNKHIMDNQNNTTWNPNR